MNMVTDMQKMIYNSQDEEMKSMTSSAEQMTPKKLRNGVRNGGMIGAADQFRTIDESIQEEREYETKVEDFDHESAFGPRNRSNQLSMVTIDNTPHKNPAEIRPQGISLAPERSETQTTIGRRSPDLNTLIAMQPKTMDLRESQ